MNSQQHVPVFGVDDSETLPDASKPFKVRKLEPESSDEPVTKLRRLESFSQDEDEQSSTSTISRGHQEERNISSLTTIQLSDFLLTTDEVTWTDKIYQNIASTFKILIRPDFYKAVMDLQLENINQLQFTQVSNHYTR